MWHRERLQNLKTSNLKNIYRDKINTGKISEAKDTLKDKMHGHVEAICGKYWANYRRL